jgi:hypothetical protein
MMEQALGTAVGVGDTVGSAIGNAKDFASGNFEAFTEDMYKPRNVFCFEIRKAYRGDLTPALLGKYYLLNGPVAYSENYKYRVSVKPTFGGSSVTYMGIGNNTISLDLEVYIFQDNFVPDERGNGIEGTGFSVQTKTNFFALAERRSGYKEFFELLFLLNGSHVTDGQLNISNSTPNPIFDELNRSENTFDYANYRLILRDFDRKRNVEVILAEDGMKVSRSVQDTNTYKINLNFIVVRDLGSRLNLGSTKVSQTNYFNVANSIIGQINDLIMLPVVLAGSLLGMASSINTVVKNVMGISTTFKNAKNLFSATGKLIDASWSDTVRTINKKKERKSIAEQITEGDASAKQWVSDIIKQIYEVTADIQSILDLSANQTVGNGVNSIEELANQPNSDFTDLIASETYGFGIRLMDLLEELKGEIISATADTEFGIYQIKSNDSFFTIADKELGDSGLAVALAQYNGMSVQSKLNVNSIMRIPMGTPTGILYPVPDNPRPQDLEESLMGADIKLDAQRGIAVSPNGDIGIVVGDESLVNNVLDIVDIPIGSIPTEPAIGNPIIIGEILSYNSIIEAGEQIRSQIVSDPRVADATLLEIYQNGDVIAFRYRVVSRSGGSFILTS